MEPNLLSHYLRLFHSDWLTPTNFSHLLSHFGGLRKATDATDLELSELNFDEEQITLLRNSANTNNCTKTEKALLWANSTTRSILCYEDPLYPALLKQIAVAPPLMFVQGDPGVLTAMQIAVVGSRKASSYGLRNAYWMAYELSLAGLVISSGMARGIDTRAHQAALAAEQKTVAVVGTGVDILYPLSNRKLADMIAVQGAIVSEFPLGTMPMPMNFPRRNRIMSGLSIGTLVIEATAKSGSLITARLALEQNRDVFAIPGLITNQQAAGCHRLIMEGARLVEKPDDILQELGIELAVDNALGSTDSSAVTHKGNFGKSKKKDTRLIQMIGSQGSELQYLLDASGMKYQQLLQQLIELEIDGKIRVTGGRYYCNL